MPPEDADKNPQVAVIVPTRNRPSELRRALESVALQGWGERLEVVVVDDASPEPVILPSSPELPRLCVIRNEKPLGAAGARNRGVDAASAPLLAFLDDDDEWLPGKLDAQREVLRDPAVGFTFGGCELRTEVDAGSGGRLRGVVESFGDPSRLADELLLRDVVVLPTLVVRRPLFEQVGGFDERFRAVNDWDLCLRLAMTAKGIAVPAVVARAWQRSGRESITSDMEKFLEGRRLFLQKHAEAIAGRPGATARHHLHIAQRLALGGRRAEARREIGASLRSGGLVIPSLGHLVAMHLPRKVYGALGRMVWRMKG